MRFRRGPGLDTSQVQDRRGAGGRGVAIGGGGLGAVALIAYLLVNVLTGGSNGLDAALRQLDQMTVAQEQPTQALGDECRTNADLNSRQDCRIVADINSIQKYWSGALPGYTIADTVFFTDSTDTGCGTATTDVGPFYCPADKHVYIDLGFFDELQSRFGARGGPLAEAYVLAHEYGHHVQDLTGLLDHRKSTAIELQADCYGGVWAKHAAQTGYITGITKQDVSDALDAAAAVGDDRINPGSSPESWTHGSSAQRDHWFTVGYDTGDRAKCATG